MFIKRFIPALFCLLIAFSTAGSAKAQQPIVINLEFDYVRQGTVGLITLSGSELNGATAAVFDRTYPFFPTNKGYVSFIAVPFNQKIKDYPVRVTLSRADDSTAEWDGTIKVASGEFVAEPTFTMPAAKVYLLRPQIEEAEETRLMKTYGMVTPERYWEGAFTMPVQGAIISPFGSVRYYSNDGVTRRHMGDDLRTPEGTSVLASSTGRIVLARPLDIHGNIVIIDHGWGVFTSYSHMSEIYVVPGQFVLQGDVIGKSGNTGRSFGPHVHWEVAVNGLEVDPMSFMKLKLPN